MNTNSDTIVGRDIYMRHTDTEGRSYVNEHRVWDAKKFVNSQAKAAADLNANVKGDGKRLAKAEQITKAVYLAERASR